MKFDGFDRYCWNTVVVNSFCFGQPSEPDLLDLRRDASVTPLVLIANVSRDSDEVLVPWWPSKLWSVSLLLVIGANDKDCDLRIPRVATFGLDLAGACEGLGFRDHSDMLISTINESTL